MPADYGKIRDENIARYGWDTAVLDLLGQLYSERTHFIFELIQNAEDAGATELAFQLFPDRLQVRHDGRPFTEADVRGVCGVGKSEKAGDLTAIGKFGIGFKSVYAYTKTPRIYSGTESFRIENYVRPFPLEAGPPAAPPHAPHAPDAPDAPHAPHAPDEPDTLFVFPFDHDDVPAPVAVQEISTALNDLAPETLLFLRRIGRLEARGTDVSGSAVERRTATGPGTSRRVTLSRGRRTDEWLVWHRQARDRPAHRVEIAFRVAPAANTILPCPSSPLTVFLPTQKETFLGFLIQGPYRTTPARDNIGEHDPANQALVAETATLLTGVLRELRAAGLLSTDVLEALPLDATRFPPGSVFRPLFDAARDALRHEELIPVAQGGYRAAAAVRLAGETALRELLSPGQLGELTGDGQPLFFAPDHLTPRLRRYLGDEIGIGEVTAEDVVAAAGATFLQARSDEWITRFYAFVHSELGLWRAARFSGERPGIARTRPIIRLEDGRHIEPFDARDRPAAYLPRPGAGSAAAGFPTVRRAIADAPAARQFLDALGFAVPELVDEVLQLILPRYGHLDVAQLDTARRDADLESIVRALDEAGHGSREHLLARLRQTAFLVGENAATGAQRFTVPGDLYQRSKELEIYFAGNPDIWFAADGYGPWLVQLRDIGVRDTVRVSARPPGLSGHVILADEFARHERGLDGFDPGAEMDGLAFALAHPDHARSEFVWNAILAPNRRLVAGVVEKSVRDEFVDSAREDVASAIAAAAEREAWLPAPDGTFRRPSELSLDDLPPTYTRDEALAKALGMARPVVAEAARQLGIPAEVLWGLSARPDLIATIRRELEGRA